MSALARLQPADASSAVPERLQLHVAAWTWAVELDQEHTLPGSELQGAVPNRHDLAAAHEQLQAVRMAVGSLVGVHVLGADTEVVMGVGRIGWGQGSQEAAQIVQQQRLGLLNADRRGGVAHEHVDEAVAHVRVAREVGHALGDVDELDRRVSVELEGVGPTDH